MTKEILAKIEENMMYIDLMEQNIDEGRMIEESEEVITELVKENISLKSQLAEQGIIVV